MPKQMSVRNRGYGLPAPERLKDFRSSSSHQTLGVRYRTACNACNAAKIKCSAERDGCRRCLENGSDCIYEESRMGKVPDAQAKRNKVSVSNNAANRVRRQMQSIPPANPQHQKPPGGAPVEDSVADWGNGAHNSLLRTSSFDPGINIFNDANREDNSWSLNDNSMLEHPLSPGLSDLVVPSLNFDLDTCSSEPSHRMAPESDRITTGGAPDAQIAGMFADQPPADLYKGMPQAVAQTDREPILDPKLNSQCVMSLAEIISSLENYILADLKAPDIVLGIVKQALSQLAELISIQQMMPGYRCIALLSVVIYQVIELFDRGCTAFVRESNPQRNPLFPGTRPSVLNFGSFGIKSEEHQSFRAHILLKELRRCSNLLQKVITIAASSAERHGPPSAVNQRECFAIIEKKLNTLIERVEKSRQM